MRILVWNINMAAHKKSTLLRHFRPDIAIVPECAVWVGQHREWLAHSDHAPLVVSVKDDKQRKEPARDPAINSSIARIE